VLAIGPPHPHGNAAIGEHDAADCGHLAISNDGDLFDHKSIETPKGQNAKTVTTETQRTRRKKVPEKVKQA
jgi:hypothetical protein